MTTLLKRDRLIEAAKTLFYQQGVTGTTLADIAERAKVPLGNVYYHFRTKDALLSSLQGTYVLTVSFRSPELLERKLQRLEMWIRSL